MRIVIEPRKEDGIEISTNNPGKWSSAIVDTNYQTIDCIVESFWIVMCWFGGQTPIHPIYY